LAGKTEVLGENLPQRHFVHHKSQVTAPMFEPGPPRFLNLSQSHIYLTLSPLLKFYIILSYDELLLELE
jgi:hypothetical protein